MGDPTSSYATASIALRVSGALKPHHLDKVETPSVGINCVHFVQKEHLRQISVIALQGIAATSGYFLF
jgi:hypothetical protein